MKARSGIFARSISWRSPRPGSQVIVVVGCVLLQVALANLIPMYETWRIQFALIAVVYFSLQQDWFPSAMTGVTGGLAMDIFSGGQIGVYALGYGIVGLLIGRVQERLVKDNLLANAAVIAAASLVSAILIFNVLALYGIELEYLSQFAKRALPLAAANAIAGCLLFSLARRMKRARSTFRKRSYR